MPISADAELDERAAEDAADRVADLAEDVCPCPWTGASVRRQRDGTGRSPAADDVRRSVAGAAADLGRARAAATASDRARVGLGARQTGGSSGA